MNPLNRPRICRICNGKARTGRFPRELVRALTGYEWLPCCRTCYDALQQCAVIEQGLQT